MCNFNGTHKQNGTLFSVDIIQLSRVVSVNKLIALTHVGWSSDRGFRFSERKLTAA